VKGEKFQVRPRPQSERRTPIDRCLNKLVTLAIDAGVTREQLLDELGAAYDELSASSYADSPATGAELIRLEAGGGMLDGGDYFSSNFRIDAALRLFAHQSSPSTSPASALAMTI